MTLEDDFISGLVLALGVAETVGSAKVAAVSLAINKTVVKQRASKAGPVARRTKASNDMRNQDAIIALITNRLN